MLDEIVNELLEADQTAAEFLRSVKGVLPSRTVYSGQGIRMVEPSNGRIVNKELGEDSFAGDSWENDGSVFLVYDNVEVGVRRVLFIDLRKTEVGLAGKGYFDKRAFSVQTLAERYPELVPALTKVVTEFCRSAAENEKKSDLVGGVRFASFIDKELAESIAVDLAEDGKDTSSLDFRLRLVLARSGVVPFESLNTGDAIFHKDHFDLLFEDWSDPYLIQFFAQDRNNDYQKSAEKLFGGDAYEWWDFPLEPIKDILNYHSIDKKNEERIRPLLIGSSVVDEDTGEEVELTLENVNVYKFEDVLEELDDSNGYDGGVIHEIKVAYMQAQESATESAFYNGYTDALEDMLGKSSFVGNKLVFKCSYSLLDAAIDHYTEYNDDDLDLAGNVVDFIHSNTNERACPNDDYWGKVTDEAFNERLSELLYELEK